MRNKQWYVFGEIREIFTEMGGKGSGNWAHRGRPGKVGGSTSRGGGAKIPPTNSTISIDETLFTETRVVRIKWATEHLPQEHCDAIDIIYQDSLGKDIMGEANKYGIITMNRDETWTKGDIQHEVGHAVFYHNKRTESGRLGMGVYERRFKRYYRSKAKESGTTLMGLKRKSADYQTRGKALKGFPTAYSMIDEHELFAESYELFVRSPRTLQKRAPDIYNYMRDEVFEGVEYTK